MSGTWDARVQVAGSGGRPAASDSSSYVIELTMKGRWIFGAEGHSREFFFVGYDRLAGRWVMLQLTASPDYSLLVAPHGWQDGSISFFGDAAYASGLNYRKRTTISRRSAAEFTLSDDELAPNGSYVPVDRYEFTKVR